MSQLIVSGTTGGNAAVTSSSTFSSSSSSSFSASSSSSSSSSKTVKSTSSSATSKSITSSSSKSVSIKSSGKSYSDQVASDLGIDVSKEMDRLKLRMSEEMTNIHRDMFQLMPMTPPPLALTGGTAAPSLGGVDAAALEQALVKLDADSVRSCIDKEHGDRMKLNFDVTEYESESISVKTVGNKIEVHAQKKSKKGDEERNEEFSRVYELPTANDVDPSHVTSSIFQDGVLTIELPVSDALAMP